MPRKGRKAAKRPMVSQRVKQDQTVKINIRNMIPERGDYITPRRGVPMDNFNMGNQSRLLGPSIQYAVRPAEYLSLPERFNSQGQPSYVREGPARVGRPDLIYQETNPNDIAPSRAPIVALPSKPLVPMIARTPGEVYRDYERQARATLGIQPSAKPVYLPQQDESEAAVAAASDQDVRDARAIQMALNRSEGAKRAWATRRMANPVGASAATSGVPNVPTPLRLGSPTPDSPPVEASEYEDPRPYASEAGHPMSAQSRYGR